MLIKTNKKWQGQFTGPKTKVELARFNIWLDNLLGRAGQYTVIEGDGGL